MPWVGPGLLLCVLPATLPDPLDGWVGGGVNGAPPLPEPVLDGGVVGVVGVFLRRRGRPETGSGDSDA